MLQILLDFFSGKAKTRLYTTFLGWLLIFHLDVIFIALLVDQSLIYEKTKLLKGEYLLSYVSHFGLWSIAIEIGRILVAILVTYLMIWVVPKLMNVKSYKEELEVEYALRKMKIKKEESLNKKEENIVKQQLENIEAEKQVAVERAKLEDTPEQVKWDSEFETFVKIPNSLQTLNQITNTVYAESGNLYKYEGIDGYLTTPKGVDAANLALADTNGLITFSEKGRSLSLTDKGKYFIKRFSSPLQ